MYSKLKRQTLTFFFYFRGLLYAKSREDEVFYLPADFAWGWTWSSPDFAFSKISFLIST
jgi:hypothetical protein